MSFAKYGKDDGHVIDSTQNLTKLGAKKRCDRCGRPFPVTNPDDFSTKICTTCRGKDGDDQE